MSDEKEGMASKVTVVGQLLDARVVVDVERVKKGTLQRKMGLGSGEEKH